jgi:hypothetical protein
VGRIANSLRGAAVGGAVLLAGCPLVENQSIVDTYRGSGNQVFVHAGFAGGVDYALQLGNANASVYLISTNTTAAPIVPLGIETNHPVTLSGAQQVAARPLVLPNQPRLARDRPASVAFNEGAPIGKKSASGIGPASAPQQAPTVVGETFVFEDFTTVPITIPATARSVVTVGATTLNIWVADDSWEACVASCVVNLVDQAMVDATAVAFLQRSSTTQSPVVGACSLV